MKKPDAESIYTSLCLTFILLFGAGLILFTKEVSAAAADAVKICASTVIPSLFPFFVLSSVMISVGAADSLGKIFSMPMRFLFRLPGECASAAVTGFTGGYPTGAKTAFELYDAGLCSEKECARLLSFCTCGGPAFIISAAGSAVLGSVKSGLLIYICHIAAAIITGLVSGMFSPIPKKSAGRRTVKPLPFAESLSKAVTSSFSAAAGVCAFVIFFSALGAFLRCCGIAEAAEHILSFIFPTSHRQIAAGLLEVTGGIASVSGSGLSPRTAMTVCAFITGWGGLSVIFQTFALRGGRNISLVPYIKGRISSALLSSLFVFASSPYILGDSGVFAPTYYYQGCFIGSPLYFITVMGVYLVCALLLSLTVSRRCKKRL